LAAGELAATGTAANEEAAVRDAILTSSPESSTVFRNVGTPPPRPRAEAFDASLPAVYHKGLKPHAALAVNPLPSCGSDHTGRAFFLSRHHRGCRMRRHALAVVLFWMVQQVAPCEAVVYRLADLGDLPEGANRSEGLALNNVGEVVGVSSVTDGRHAFLYSAGVMTDLGVLYADHHYSYGLDVNDSGHVVGKSSADDVVDPTYLFYWSNGVMTEIPGFGVKYGFARAINNAGEVAGLSCRTDGVTHGFLYSGGATIDLGSLEGFGGYSCAYGINDHTQIVGVSSIDGRNRGFLWQEGSMIDIGDLVGGMGNTRAYRINRSGQVVGETWDTAPATAHGFFWDNGVMTDLGLMPGTSGPASQALGVNDLGEVVGTASGGPFIWDSVNGMRDLRTMVDASAAGWDLRQAHDINNVGQIAGFGIDPQGNLHGFLLTPVPEPATSTILATAVVVLLAYWGWVRINKTSLLGEWG